MSDHRAGQEPDRITIENVNHPGSVSTVDATMYRAMRDALLKVLPAEAPGMTIAEMREAVSPELPQDLFPGGAGESWWSKSVQLDLEAKGLIAREPTSPLRLHRTA